MSGKGKLLNPPPVARGKSGGPPPPSGESRTARCGLQFPIGKIGRWMKEGAFASRIGVGGPIFLAAVLEYLTAEVLEMAGTHAKETKKRRITPQHILYAIRGDPEMNQLLSDVTISSGGVVPSALADVSKMQTSFKKKSADDGSMDDEDDEDVVLRGHEEANF